MARRRPASSAPAGGAGGIRGGGRGGRLSSGGSGSNDAGGSGSSAPAPPGIEVVVVLDGFEAVAVVEGEVEVDEGGGFSPSGGVVEAVVDVDCEGAPGDDDVVVETWLSANDDRPKPAGAAISAAPTMTLVARRARWR